MRPNNNLVDDWRMRLYVKMSGMKACELQGSRIIYFNFLLH